MKLQSLKEKLKIPAFRDLVIFAVTLLFLVVLFIGFELAEPLHAFFHLFKDMMGEIVIITIMAGMLFIVYIIRRARE
jgi:hypothetical protein